ncbi:hypothetical protein [Burkholderia sp. TSV86]|uniref:hypothetical protein n=1 Tax=Burkholderia sp. TSV86 TaxID=1385594 RepID=UPI001E3A24A6|nr:hypothetical protein [Burkholderia sp. TSV86]
MSLPNKQSTPTGTAMEAIAGIFQKFIIDYWYKMLIPISVILFILAITTDLHTIPNGPLVLLSIGLFMIGLGEWINHPLQTSAGVNFGQKMVIVAHPRRPKVGGVVLDIVGAILGFIGFVKIIIATI